MSPTVAATNITGDFEEDIKQRGVSWGRRINGGEQMVVGVPRAARAQAASGGAHVSTAQRIMQANGIKPPSKRPPPGVSPPPPPKQHQPQEPPTHPGAAATSAAVATAATRSRPAQLAEVIEEQPASCCCFAFSIGGGGRSSSSIAGGSGVGGTMGGGAGGGSGHLQIPASRSLTTSASGRGAPSVTMSSFRQANQSMKRVPQSARAQSAAAARNDPPSSTPSNDWDEDEGGEFEELEEFTNNETESLPANSTTTSRRSFRVSLTSGGSRVPSRAASSAISAYTAGSKTVPKSILKSSKRLSSVTTTAPSLASCPSLEGTSLQGAGSGSQVDSMHSSSAAQTYGVTAPPGFASTSWVGLVATGAAAPPSSQTYGGPTGDGAGSEWLHALPAPSGGGGADGGGGCSARVAVSSIKLTAEELLGLLMAQGKLTEHDVQELGLTPGAESRNSPGSGGVGGIGGSGSSVEAGVAASAAAGGQTQGSASAGGGGSGGSSSRAYAPAVGMADAALPVTMMSGFLTQQQQRVRFGGPHAQLATDASGAISSAEVCSGGGLVVREAPGPAPNPPMVMTSSAGCAAVTPATMTPCTPFVIPPPSQQQQLLGVAVNHRVRFGSEELVASSSSEVGRAGISSVALIPPTATGSGAGVGGGNGSGAATSFLDALRSVAGEVDTPWFAPGHLQLQQQSLVISSQPLLLPPSLEAPPPPPRLQPPRAVAGAPSFKHLVSSDVDSSLDLDDVLMSTERHLGSGGVAARRPQTPNPPPPPQQQVLFLQQSLETVRSPADATARVFPIETSSLTATALADFAGRSSPMAVATPPPQLQHAHLDALRLASFGAAYSRGSSASSHRASDSGISRFPVMAGISRPGSRHSCNGGPGSLAMTVAMAAAGGVASRPSSAVSTTSVTAFGSWAPPPNGVATAVVLASAGITSRLSSNNSMSTLAPPSAGGRGREGGTGGRHGGGGGGSGSAAAAFGARPTRDVGTIKGSASAGPPHTAVKGLQPPAQISASMNCSGPEAHWPATEQGMGAVDLLALRKLQSHMRRNGDHRGHTATVEANLAMVPRPAPPVVAAPPPAPPLALEGGSRTPWEYGHGYGVKGDGEEGWTSMDSDGSQPLPQGPHEWEVSMNGGGSGGGGGDAGGGGGSRSVRFTAPVVFELDESDCESEGSDTMEQEPAPVSRVSGRGNGSGNGNGAAGSAAAGRHRSRGPTGRMNGGGVEGGTWL